MDWIKLIAAIIITLIIIGGCCLVTRITVKTDWLFMLILVFIALVAGVYASL